MKAYSLDLRERVLRAVDQGKPRPEMVKMLGVSLATIKGYLKQRRETGHVRPKAMPGRPARKGGALQAGLVAQLETHPDVSLQRCPKRWSYNLTHPFLSGEITAVLKPTVGSLRRHGKQRLRDCIFKGLARSGLRASQPCLHLREGLFNGREIGEVGR